MSLRVLNLMVNCLLPVVVAMSFTAVACAEPLGPDAPEKVRVGFSVRTMGGANPNDVTAAMKVWIQTLAMQRQMAADPDPRIYGSVEDFAEALRNGEVEIVSAPTDEFFILQKVVPLTGLFATQVGEGVTEKYVVVVPRDSPVEALAELKGCRLNFFDHPRTSLARIWLDVELMREGLPLIDSFFGEVTEAVKMNRALLPVFFGQADACLVNRRSFELAGELNPQVNKKLRILLTSPPLVPALGAYRANAGQSSLTDYHKEVTLLNTSPVGRHVLNLFQCDDLVEIDESDLEVTRLMLEEFVRLKENLSKGES